MGSRAIEAESQKRKPVGSLSTARRAMTQAASPQREGASGLFFSLIRRRPEPGTVGNSRAPSRGAARVSALGVCILWVLIGTAEIGSCGEPTTRTQAFTAPTEGGRVLGGPYPIRNGYLPLSPAAETMAAGRLILERGAKQIDNHAGPLRLAQRSDAAPDAVAKPPQTVPAGDRENAVQREQERDKAEALARALSRFRAELNSVRSAAEAAEIRQGLALKQERQRAEAMARELASLRAELDTARAVGRETVQAIELGMRQTQTLEQEREKANNLARELTFLRAELEAARMAVSKAVQAAEAEPQQEQALEQERGRADNLARELASARAELDKARIAGSANPEAAQAAAATAEQKQAADRDLEQQRDRAEALARSLASVQAERDAARTAASEAERATGAAVQHQQTTERELGQQRDRADASRATLLPFRRNATWLETLHQKP